MIWARGTLNFGLLKSLVETKLNHHFLQSFGLADFSSTLGLIGVFGFLACLICGCRQSGLSLGVVVFQLGCNLCFEFLFTLFS